MRCLQLNLQGGEAREPARAAAAAAGVAAAGADGVGGVGRGDPLRPHHHSQDPRVLLPPVLTLSLFLSTLPGQLRERLCSIEM